MHIAFVGLGYIGLPTAVVMANSGLNVTGIDINKSNVDRINNGEVTIIEPGLEQALKDALETGRFRAQCQPTSADVFVIAVPTPFNDDHSLDISYIYAAAESIAPVLKGGELIILESTSPPKTTERLATRILELRPDLSLDPEDEVSGLFFAYCPERILPGRALAELRKNDRIIGGINNESTVRATRVYGSFCEGELLPSSAITAEMAKLTENSFRDVNIAFANELSIISENLGINVWEVIRLANHHPRVNILQPGPGVGGHCIAVDPWFIVSADYENARLIRTAREVNDSKVDWIVEKTVESLFKSGEAISAFGLAFKPDIDDLRESPAVEIIHKLAEQYPEQQILVVEPNIDTLPPVLAGFDNVDLVSVDDALERSRSVLILVDHREFKSLDPKVFGGKNVLDSKGLLRGIDS